jgi:hypothetical protein
MTGNADPNTPPSNPPSSHKEETQPNPTVIKSLWVKEKTWARLNTLKSGFQLTWSEFFDLLILHMQQSGATPPDCLQKLQDLSEDYPTAFEKTTFLLGSPWWESGEQIKNLANETQNLNTNLELLIDTLEDHAETTLLTQT